MKFLIDKEKYREALIIMHSGYWQIISDHYRDVWFINDNVVWKIEDYLK